ncbi:ISAs1 family transposase [Methylosinus sp. Ce-a6]|uniref:ISAs1 family transposase n=1 Tax=Methylosinus sp. Ce-a6 TaxID=2172005 RepID=UPI00135A8936|nr:ISAs1 family transposase [Methylosinus sp. Ce-a6]
MRIVLDHRIPGMVTYPLDEILLTTLVGVICGADDWDGVEEIAAGALDWLRGYLLFANGVATAQTLRKVFRLLDPKALEQGFAAWAGSVRPLAREVVAVDGKTLRGSRRSDGTGALHLVSAYATSAGLVLAQRAVAGKSNEIGCKLVGRWRIVEADLWDRAYLDLCGQPTIVIGADGRGEIAFGAMQATLDLEYGPTSIAFTWIGFDEMAEVSGERTAELLDDGSIEIEFEYDNGDEAVLKATRDGFSTAC